MHGKSVHSGVNSNGTVQSFSGKRSYFPRYFFFPIQPEFPKISVQYVDNLIPGSLRRHFREKKCLSMFMHAGEQFYTAIQFLPVIFPLCITILFLVCTFPFSFVCCILLYVCMFIILGRFRVQFGITKHELIFQSLPKFVV